MDSVIIRFPDGTKEFRYPPQPLKEGDLVWHGGQAYRVLAVEGDRPTAVTVELDSQDTADLLRSERGGVVLEELIPSS